MKDILLVSNHDMTNPVEIDFSLDHRRKWMNNLAIIDIGSNSIRMVIFQVRSDGTFKLIDEVKESVRLGDNLNGSNLLRADKISYAIATLRFFLDLKQALYAGKVICVATEAIRRAKNRTEFLEAAKAQLGLDIRVLTGTEEAYYDYVGAANSLILPDCLLVDIGGSSTELLRVIDNQISNSASIPMGAITVSQMFHLENAAGEQTIGDMQRYVKAKFAEVDWVGGVPTVIGIGGSFRNLAKVDQNRKRYPLDIIHNYAMRPADVRAIGSMLLSLSEKERKKVKGLSRDRADILPGALMVMSTLLDLTKASDIIISGAGLREGLFYDWLLRGKHPLKDVCDFSIQNVMGRLEINQSHAEHVWDIAQQLYEQLRNELKINGNLKVLKAAALLHDSGVNISFYDHQRHSFYEILNSRLNGMSHKELLMTAWVASMHRKNSMKLAAPYRALLNDGDILAAHQLGVLLHIAESLDRRKNGNTRGIRCSFARNRVRIEIAARVSPDLEIKDAQAVLPHFKRVFRRQLVFEAAGPE